jgi:ComF family protein
LELEERGLCGPCFSALQKLRLEPSEERIRIPLSHGQEGWALFRYDGGVKEVLHKIKFERRRDLIPLFTEEMTAFLARRRPRVDAYDLVVPIPLDPERRLEREFNQSSLIAQIVSRITGLTVPRNVLKKRHSTPPQTLLGREGRQLNLREVFRVTRPALVRGKSVLLVDDIFTTGSTFEEAAKTLQAAGAERVGYFALARAFLN